MAKNENKLSDIKMAKELFKNNAVLIEQCKVNLALTINTEITLLYWQIGKVISTTLLKNKRAEYGEAIVATLSQQLSLSFGKGYTKSALSRMINFSKTFDDEQKNCDIVATIKLEPLYRVARN